MYSLDINFVKDRPEANIDKGKQLSKLRLPTGNATAVYLGLAPGLLLPALAGGGWFFLQNKNAQLEQQVAQINAELNRLGIQEQELQKIQEDTNQIQGETQALASVFDQVRPTSAILQDISDRIPVAVQIESLKQNALLAPEEGQPPPNASTPQQSQKAANPAGQIEITGIARSFNDVNDFLLTLQQSPFFKPIETKIVTAELVDSPILPDTSGRVKLPQVVRYTIQSSLSDAQASELLRELERKGTVGLVTRIRALQKMGVLVNQIRTPK